VIADVTHGWSVVDAGVRRSRRLAFGAAWKGSMVERLMS
jgi:hypothetical protein